MIETDHLLLRRPTLADTLILGNLWRNDLVRAFLGGTLSEENIKEKILALQLHWEKHPFGLCSVIDKNNKEVIGLCGSDYSDEMIEISYMFFPQIWGKGFAREAIIATINYLFGTLNEEAVTAITQQANLKSCRLLEKAGFQYINSIEKYNAIQSIYRMTNIQWGQVFARPSDNDTKPLIKKLSNK